MLIKRNVYFSAIDEDGEERLYSTTEVMDEQDYIERLYAEAEDEEAVGGKKGLSSLQAAGIGGAAAATATAGAGAGLYFGGEKLGKHLEKRRKKALEKLQQERSNYLDRYTDKTIGKTNLMQWDSSANGGKGGMVDKSMGLKEIEGKIAAKGQAGKLETKLKNIKDYFKNAKGLAEAEEKLVNSRKLSGAAKTAAEQKAVELNKAAKALARNRKLGAAGIALGTTAVGTGIGYGIHKYRHRNDN